MKEYVIVIAFMLIVIAIFLFSMLFISASDSTTEEDLNIKKKKQGYDRTRLLEFITKEDAGKYFDGYGSWKSSYPPLKPDRFRRKMKMLFGIDVNDYPKNALIGIFYNFYDDNDLAGNYVSVEDQHLYNLWMSEKEPYGEESRSPFDGMEFNIGEDYGKIILDYIFYNDLVALDSIATYKYRLFQETLGEKWKEEDIIAAELLEVYDIVYEIYEGLHTTKPELIRYADKNRVTAYPSNHQHLRVDYKLRNQARASAIRSDLHFLYIQREKKNNKSIVLNYYDNETLDDISVSANEFSLSYFNKSNNHFPWRENTPARSTAEYLDFLVKLQEKKCNSFIIEYLTGKSDYFATDGDRIREQIRSNNYYGHAVLREYCENPEWETPSLEKVGASFDAVVKKSEALLYLEPYPDSYDIDTIHSDEKFIAYDMGHDDYFFVEVVKPIESPVAGSDGYAMILDRTETVYGYLKRTDVKKFTDADVIIQTVMSDRSKQRVINDSDGYVNIRTEMNVQSEIVGKILNKEVFRYWELPGKNWCVVKTQDGRTGFVYKDRIKEKLNTGGWVILDD